MAIISTPTFGELSFVDRRGKIVTPQSTKKDRKTGQITGFNLSLYGVNPDNNRRTKGLYTFVPQSLVEKGWIKNDRQYYFHNILDPYNVSMLRDNGALIDLAGLDYYDKFAADNNISTTGFLLPFRDVSRTGLITSDIRSYKLEKDGWNRPIQSLGFINEKPVYVVNTKPGSAQNWIQQQGTVHYMFPDSGLASNATVSFKGYSIEPPKKRGGLLGFVNDLFSSDLFKIGSLALGAYGLYNLATAPAIAAGSGLSASAGGITGLTPGAAGITGLVAPAGFTLAPELGLALGATGASGILDLPSTGLLDTTTFPKEGIKATPATTGGASAPFATTPAYSELTTVVPAGGGAATVPGLSVPGLSSMGGGTGLTVPVTGGTVTEMGFVPTGATPSLGDPASFINNPDYLNAPVISEDYLALTGADMPGGLSTKDALDLARRGAQLLSPQQQMMQQGGLLGDGSGQPQLSGADFSSLYGRTLVGLLPLAEQYRRSLL